MYSRRRPPRYRDEMRKTHPIVFKGPKNVDAGLGDTIWPDAANSNMYANIRPATQREVYEAQQSQQRLSHVVTIWRIARSRFIPAHGQIIEVTNATGAAGDSVTTQTFQITAVDPHGYTGREQTIYVYELKRGIGN